MAVKAGARRRLQLECETSGPEAISEKRSVRLVLRSINTAVGDSMLVGKRFTR